MKAKKFLALLLSLCLIVGLLPVTAMADGEKLLQKTESGTITLKWAASEDGYSEVEGNAITVTTGQTLSVEKTVLAALAVQTTEKTITINAGATLKVGDDVYIGPTSSDASLVLSAGSAKITLGGTGATQSTPIIKFDLLENAAATIPAPTANEDKFFTTAFTVGNSTFAYTAMGIAEGATLNVNSGSHITDDSGTYGFRVAKGSGTTGTTLTNNGTIAIGAGGIMDVSTGATVTNAGTITVAGATDTNSAGVLNNKGTVTNSGTIESEGTIAGKITSSTGKVEVKDGTYGAVGDSTYADLTVEGNGTFTISGGTFGTSPEAANLASGKAVVPNLDASGETESYSVVDKAEAEYTVAWSLNGTAKTAMTGKDASEDAETDDGVATTKEKVYLGDTIEITGITGGQKSGRFQKLLALAQGNSKTVYLAYAVVDESDEDDPKTLVAGDFGVLTVNENGAHEVTYANVTSSQLKLGYAGTLYIFGYDADEVTESSSEIEFDAESSPTLVKMTVLPNTQDFRIGGIALTPAKTDNNDGKSFTGSLTYTGVEPPVEATVTATASSNKLAITVDDSNGASYMFESTVPVTLTVGAGEAADLSDVAEVTYQIGKESEDVETADPENITIEIAQDAKIVTLPNKVTTIGVGSAATQSAEAVTTRLTGALTIKPNTDSGFDFTLGSDLTVNTAVRVDQIDNFTLNGHAILGPAQTTEEQAENKISLTLASDRTVAEVGANFYYDADTLYTSGNVPAGVYVWDGAEKWVQEGYAVEVTITGGPADLGNMTVSAKPASGSAIALTKGTESNAAKYTGTLPAGTYTLEFANVPANYRVTTDTASLTLEVKKNLQDQENKSSVALEAFAYKTAVAALGAGVTAPNPYTVVEGTAKTNGAIPLTITATGIRKWTNGTAGYWAGFAVYPTVGSTSYVAPAGVKYEKLTGASTSFTSAAKTAAAMAGVATGSGNAQYNGYAFYEDFAKATPTEGTTNYYLVQFFADANCTTSLGAPTLYEATWIASPKTVNVTLAATALESKSAELSVDGEAYTAAVPVLVDEGTLTFNVKTPDAKNFKIKSVTVTAPSTGKPTLAATSATADEYDQDYTLTNVTSDTTVTVTLEKIIPTVTAIKINKESTHQTAYPTGTVTSGLKLDNLVLDLTKSNGDTEVFKYSEKSTADKNRVKAEIDATNNTRVNISYLDTNLTTVLATTYFNITYYTEYTITPATVSGVKFTVTAPAAVNNAYKAQAEETVKFTAVKNPTTAAGILIVSVTDANGGAVSVAEDTEVANGYSFTMPASNVTISASLEEEAPVMTEADAVDKNGDAFKVEAKVGASAAEKDLLDGLTLVIHFDKGADKTVTFNKTDDNADTAITNYRVTADSSVIKSGKIAGDGEATVTYWNEARESVSATFSIETYTETEVAFVTTLDGEATTETVGEVYLVKADGTAEEEATVKTTVQSNKNLVFQVVPEGSYVVDSKTPITPEAQQTTNGWSIAGSTFNENTKTVTINFTQKEFSISSGKPEGWTANDKNDYTSGTVVFTVGGEEVTMAKPGTSVSVEIKPINGKVVADGGVTWSEKVVSYAKSDDTHYSFVMPAADAKISVIYVDAPSTDNTLKTVLNKAVTVEPGTKAAPAAQTITVAGNFSGSVSKTDVVATGNVGEETEIAKVALFSDAAFTTNVTTAGWTYKDDAKTFYVMVTAQDTSVVGYYAITIEKDATTTAAETTASTDDNTGKNTSTADVDGSDANVEAVKAALADADALNIDASTTSEMSNNAEATVTVPTSIVDALTSDDPAESSKGANIETNAGAIELPGEAMDQIKAALGEDATGMTMALVSQNAPDDTALKELNTSESAIATTTGQKAQMVFTAEVKQVGGTNNNTTAEISGLQEPIKLSIPLGTGFGNRNAKVWYLDTTFGTLTKMEGTAYDKETGIMSVPTSHLSTFIVTVDEGDVFVQDISDETGSTFKTRTITLDGEYTDKKVVVWITQGEGNSATQYMLTIDASATIEVSYKGTATEVQVSIVSARPDFNDAENGYEGIKVYHSAKTE